MPSATSTTLQRNAAVVSDTRVDGTQSTCASLSPKAVLSLDLIGDHTTEILSVDSIEHPLGHLVIIPGNPGEWLNQVSALEVVVPCRLLHMSGTD